MAATLRSLLALQGQGRACPWRDQRRPRPVPGPVPITPPPPITPLPGTTYTHHTQQPARVSASTVPVPVLQGPVAGPGLAGLAGPVLKGPGYYKWNDHSGIPKDSRVLGDIRNKAARPAWAQRNQLLCAGSLPPSGGKGRACPWRDQKGRPCGP